MRFEQALEGWTSGRLTQCEADPLQGQSERNPPCRRRRPCRRSSLRSAPGHFDRCPDGGWPKACRRLNSGPWVTLRFDIGGRIPDVPVRSNDGKHGSWHRGMAIEFNAEVGHDVATWRSMATNRAGSRRFAPPARPAMQCATTIDRSTTCQ